MQPAFVSYPHFFRSEQESGCSSLKEIPLKRTYTGNKEDLLLLWTQGAAAAGGENEN
jgi:hypothetical protein